MVKRMKTIIAVIVVFAVVIPAAVFYIHQNNTEKKDTYYSDLTAIIGKYDSGISKSEAEKNPYALSRLVVSGWNGKKYGAVEIAFDKKNDMAVLQYSSPEKAKSAEKEILSDGMKVQPDSLVYLDETEKCSMSPQNSSALGINTYLDNFVMDKDDVTVAVIDTGVMYNHEALSGRFVSNGVDLSGDNMSDAYYDSDERGEHYGHGTSVCGIIADNTPDNVKILPIKVVPFGTDYAASSVIASAMNYAIDNGADVISISVSGTGFVYGFGKAMTKALSRGVCVCASAGNESQEITERYPACTEGVITVSALDSTNSQIASYSNYGSEIDFCAPGYKINTSYPENGLSSYKSVSGTSYSTPYIAALCADIKSIDSDMSKDDVYQSLCDFAIDLGDSGKDIYYGNGMPYIGSMTYSGEGYSFAVPQGTLHFSTEENFAENNRPWERYAAKMKQVNINPDIHTIGDYAFCNMKSAEFILPSNIISVGDYSFYSCKSLSSITFGLSINNIGYKAFADIEDLTVCGYGNTPAETYALNEGINFNSLGCKHRYYREAFPYENEPYILAVCSVCGETVHERYVAPTVLSSGKCGENLNFEIDSLGRLRIYGSGDMYDYTNSRPPWFNRRESLKILDIDSGIESISQFAFLGCDSILKIYVSPENANLSTDGVSLFSKSGDELVLTFARGRYRLPDSVDKLSAPAFVAANNIAIDFNSHFSIKDSVIYDENSNICAALPSYRERTLTVNKVCEIKPYAFVLCDYPVRLESGIVDLTVGEYALGYKFEFTLKKHDFSVRACAENGAMAYAQQRGFATETGYTRCGENLSFYYNPEYAQLNICGSGDMDSYNSSDDIPWNDVIDDVSSVVISDGVSSLSPYSFTGAVNLNYLTMPLSMLAPDVTVWNGCTDIKKINLTLGTGIMDDYTSVNYAYTPWYKSRATITELTLDSRAKYIGTKAFRGCSALKTVNLECVEEIGEDAFIACAYLNDFTIHTKNVVLPDYCIFSYMGNTRQIYSRSVLTAYCDSTAKDYCDRLGVTLNPLGCGHSRNITLMSEESDGYTNTLTYYCSDCGETFTEQEDITVQLSGRVVSTNGVPIKNVAVTVDSVTAQCNENGEFTVDGIPSGNQTVSVSANGVNLFSQIVNISGEINSVLITVHYADYIPDGTVNAKDYAYALKNGYNDKEQFDFGKIQSGENRIEFINNEN